MIDITTTMNEYNTSGNLQTVYPITFQGATDNNGSPMLRVILTYTSTSTTRALVYNVDYSLVFEETVPDLDESLNTPVLRGIKLLNEEDAALGNHLEIYRSTPFVQGIDFQVGRIDPEQVERGFDLSVLRDQEIATNVSDLKAYVDAQDNAIREIAIAADEKAGQAIDIANDAKDIAQDAKDIAEDTKDIVDGFDDRLTQAEDDARDAKNTVNTHITDYNNPHQVTKTQVGLGNVDNTADIDKPVIVKSATIPTASVDLVGKEYQYFGTTNGTYTHGFVYECVATTVTNTLILFTPVGTGKLSFDYAHHGVYELFERIAAILTTFSAEDVVSGSFTLDKVNELWSIDGYDTNGNALFTNFTVSATGDEYSLDAFGFVYTFPFPDDYEEGHEEAFSIVQDTQTTYSWERVNVQPVIDNLTSTSTTSALSANQGKVLNDRIDDVSGRGRYLSLWNCVTGLAETNPPTSPYTYKAGDYYIVGTVSAADPAVNYKPDGSSYTTGTASTTVETNEVSINDTYFYDGTVWKLQSNAQKEVSFSALAGSPYDNTNLSNALNGKANTADIKNATVTINQGGVQKGQFTLNQATDTTINLSDGQIIQVDTMPVAGADNVGRIVQWIGATDTYENGYFYQCSTVSVPSSATITASEGSGITDLEINLEDFESYIDPTGNITIVFTYDGAEEYWSYPDETDVDMEGCGISYSGTPQDGDTITVVYTAESSTYGWVEKLVQHGITITYNPETEELTIS